MKKVILALTLCISLINAAEAYISQDLIDTAINNAYYGFVAASDDAGRQYTKESAIAHAKAVVVRMKKLAEKDPNKRYILWKLSELEDQIRLEEEEVDLKAQYEKVKEINRLVKIFNKELFLELPSFAKLHALHAQMTVISINHTNQLATNINQKQTAVNQLIRNKANNAFNSKNYTAAETIYRYAIKNRKYLGISSKEYANWGGLIKSKRDADYLKANISSKMNYLKSIVDENRISEARRNVEVLHKDLTSAGKHLPSKFTYKANNDLNKLTLTIDEKEDELVKKNYSLIKGKNTDAAVNYMETVLRPAGVNLDKIASVDRAILAAGGSVVRDNREVNADIASMQTSGTYLTATELNSSMKHKADSLRAYKKVMEAKCDDRFKKKNSKDIKAFNKSNSKKFKNRAKANNYLAAVDMHLDNNEWAKGSKKFDKKKGFLFNSASPDLYYKTKKRLNKFMGIPDYKDSEIGLLLKKIDGESPEKMQDSAMLVTEKIYNALEARDVDEAYSQYFFNRQILEKYSYDSSYKTLKKTVVKSYTRKYFKNDKKRNKKS